MLRKIFAALLLSINATTAESEPMAPIYVMAAGDTDDGKACGVSNVALKEAAEAHLRSKGVVVAQRADYVEGRATALNLTTLIARAPSSKICAFHLQVTWSVPAYYSSKTWPNGKYADVVFCDESKLGLSNQSFADDSPLKLMEIIDKCLAKYPEESEPQRLGDNEVGSE